MFFTLLYNTIFPRPSLPPETLYHYHVTCSRNNVLDSDYNIHKSNSTYFSDLDVSRTHLLTHLLGPALPKIAANAKVKLVRDSQGEVVQGSLGIGIGAVSCTFRKGIAIMQPFEVWSRVLAWDHKWLYIMSHFVVKGKVKASAAGSEQPHDLPKYILATAITTYVFKLDRFTVHPAIVLQANGFLPAKPDGTWSGSGEDGLEKTADELEKSLKNGSGSWQWMEYERRKGLALAHGFRTLDRTMRTDVGVYDQMM